MKEKLKKGNNKLMAVLAILVFGASMLPIWYLAAYARPSGDDYGYSALTVSYTHLDVYKRQVIYHSVNR